MYVYFALYHVAWADLPRVSYNLTLWLKETWLEKQKCFFSVTPQNGGLKNDKTHLNIDNSWFTNYIGGHKFSAQAKCSRKLEFLTHW